MPNKTEAEKGPEPVVMARPRMSLQRRLVVWVMAATAVPVFLAAYAHNQLMHRDIDEQPAQAVTLVGRTLSAALSSTLSGGWCQHCDKIVDAVTEDPRVNLVLVSDADKNVIHRRAMNPDVYRLLNEHGVSEDAFSLDIGRTHSIGDHGEVAVRVFPIWSTLEHPKSRSRIEGYVLTAVHDERPTLAAHRAGEVNLMIAAGTLLLALPMVMISVRRWMKPLQRVMFSMHRLGEGEHVDPVPEHNRDEIGLLGAAFNRTSARLAEAHEQLVMHNEQLEELVAQRTEQMEQANTQLAAQVEEKTQFLRSVSHDLGAPLRNIDGMATLVLKKYREELNDDVVKKLERICANVKQETELIGDLTKLSKLSEKKTDSQVVDTRALLEEIAGAMSHQFEQAGIRFEINGDMPSLKVERNRIRQVFQNLIDNASKYMMDSPSKRITVSTEDDLEYFGFAVSDTGRGIAWEDQPKVFGVFQRGTHSGTHEMQGRGIGLATVKSIVESYGGQVWVESDLGKGSTFHFTIERKLVSPPMAAESVPA